MGSEMCIRDRRWPEKNSKSSELEDLKDRVSKSLREADDQNAKDQLTQDTRLALFREVRGWVPILSCDQDGSRLVQRVIELVWGREQWELVGELQGKVSEAVASKHANHVLQRCIEVMPPSAVHFILHELQSVYSPSDLAKHRYGNRVFQRMIEHFHPSQLDAFVDGVVEKAQELSTHEFGTFVIQNVIEHGSIHHKRIISNMLIANVEQVAIDWHASIVLDKALTYTTFKHDLAKAILDKEGLVVEMAIKSKHSSKATKRLFEVCEGHDVLENSFKEQVSKRLSDFQESKHGLHLLYSSKRKKHRTPTLKHYVQDEPLF